MHCGGFRSGHAGGSCLRSRQSTARSRMPCLWRWIAVDCLSALSLARQRTGRTLLARRFLSCRRFAPASKPTARRPVSCRPLRGQLKYTSVVSISCFRVPGVASSTPSTAPSPTACPAARMSFLTSPAWPKPSGSRTGTIRPCGTWRSCHSPAPSSRSTPTTSVASSPRFADSAGAAWSLTSTIRSGAASLATTVWKAS